MAGHREKSTCPVSNSLDLIGDKWSLLIVRDMFAGKTLYREFMASPEGIATNILASRLRDLEQAGIIEKNLEKGSARRPAYQLTEKGRALYPVLNAIADWGLSQIPGTEIRVGVVETKGEGSL